MPPIIYMTYLAPLYHTAPSPKFANEQREQAIGRSKLNFRLSLALYRMCIFVSSLSHTTRYVHSPTEQTWRKANAIKLFDLSRRISCSQRKHTCNRPQINLSEPPQTLRRTKIGQRHILRRHHLSSASSN